MTFAVAALTHVADTHGVAHAYYCMRCTWLASHTSRADLEAVSPWMALAVLALGSKRTPAFWTSAMGAMRIHVHPLSLVLSIVPMGMSKAPLDSAAGDHMCMPGSVYFLHCSVPVLCMRTFGFGPFSFFLEILPACMCNTIRSHLDLSMVVQSVHTNKSCMTTASRWLNPNKNLSHAAGAQMPHALLLMLSAYCSHKNAV